MKNHLLILTVSVQVVSEFASLSDTIQEFEQQTLYCFSDTDHVRVVEAEILRTEIFNDNS